MKKFVTLGTECVKYLKATRLLRVIFVPIFCLSPVPVFASLFDFLLLFLNYRCFGGS
jgi:hypothetical protein